MAKTEEGKSNMAVACHPNNNLCRRSATVRTEPFVPDVEHLEEYTAQIFNAFLTIPKLA